MAWYNLRSKNDKTPDRVRIPQPGKVRSAFLAANVSRLTAGRRASIGGPNREVQANLKNLRALARDQVRNNPIAGRFVQLMQTNVIGPNGYQFTPQILNDKTGDLDHITNQELKKQFAAWSKAVTVDGTMSLIDCLSLVVSTLMIDGECFIRLVVGPDVKNRWQFGLLLIDADQINSDLNGNVNGNEDGSCVVQGVHLDKLGRPLGYYIHAAHPDDIRGGRQTLPEYVPADEILHIVNRERIGRVRGVTAFANCLDALETMQDYLQAEVSAASIAAMNTGTIEQSATDVTPYTDTHGDADVLEFEPGTFVRLKPGEKFNAISYAHPTTQFGMFVQQMGMIIASGLGVTYSALFSNASLENYAGGRMQLITERQRYKAVQEMLVRQLLEPMYSKWVECALYFGAMPLIGKDAEQLQAVRFASQTAVWADPLREVKAWETSIANGIISKQMVCALSGLDYREVQDQRYENMKLEAENMKALYDAGLADYLPKAESPAIVEAKPAASEND